MAAVDYKAAIGGLLTVDHSSNCAHGLVGTLGGLLSNLARMVLNA